MRPEVGDVKTKIEEPACPCCGAKSKRWLWSRRCAGHGDYAGQHQAEGDALASYRCRGRVEPG